MEGDTQVQNPTEPVTNGVGRHVPELPELSSRLQEVVDKLAESEQYSANVEVIKGMECDDLQKVNALINQLVKCEQSVKEGFLEVLLSLGMEETANSLRNYITTEDQTEQQQNEETKNEDQYNNQESDDQRSYKEVLTQTSGTLVDCLFPTPQLLDHLNKSSVLSDSMVAEITVRPNRADKVKILLSFLINLGPESLNALVKALQATEQHFLAGLLSAFQYN